MSLRDYGWNPFFANQLGLDELDVLIPARVVAMHRSGVVLTDGDVEFRLALGSGWLQREAEERPTVGDWLLVAPSRDKAVRILERKSLLKRLAAGLVVDTQLIAANVDTIFVVTSCNEEFNPSRLERYLALATDAGADPVVVLTKRDLADDPDVYVDLVRAVASSAAVEVVNALDESTLSGTRGWCRAGQTVALVGSSGVGKSTLVNSLLGREVQSTGGIRENDSHGRHTTTSRSLHLMREGALLLDVPGLRELGLAGVDRAVSEVFEDVETLASRCRFADCAHESEPGCAVRQAIEAGDLDPRRFRNYQKLLREEARNAATMAERRQAHRKFAKRVRNVMKEKQRRSLGTRPQRGR